MDPGTTPLYTLSLHDALPISRCSGLILGLYKTSVIDSSPLPTRAFSRLLATVLLWLRALDRKSTRLNSSHLGISYAVFCLKKKTGDISPVAASDDELALTHSS